MNKTSRFRRRVRPYVWDTLSLLLRPTTGRRVLPDYLIVGTQRGGTTSLQQMLTAHPNIRSARLMKGVHYFDTGYHRGPDWYRVQFPTRQAAARVQASTGHPLRVGEASPFYMFHPLAAERIQRDLPRVKLIALLRDPVERAISHHKHEVRRGNEPLGLAAALDAEKERLEGEAEAVCAGQPRFNSHALQTFSYAARGDYAGQVERLFELFGRDRVLVMSSEDLFSDPDRAGARILRFIDVPPFDFTKFPHTNDTKRQSVDPEVRAWLTNRFAEGNELLFDLLGERFAWQ